MSLIVPSQFIYHLYNQGNQKKPLFLDTLDYYHFLKLYKKFVHQYCDLFAWCLMPNHFHFMLFLKPEGEEKIKIGSLEMSLFSNGMRLLQSQYCQYFNNKYGTTGNLFRQKAKIKCCNEMHGDYRLTLFNYIHFNPVHDGLVNSCNLWSFSSYNDYFNKRGGTLINSTLTNYYLGIEIEKTYF